MSVLLWGRPEEPIVAAVTAALTATEVPVVAADTPEIATIDGALGVLRTANGHSLDLGQVTGVLVRPEAGTGDPRRYAALAAWTEQTEAVTLNRLSAGASNMSKPYQLTLIEAAGFDVPDTIVTTDREVVEAFLDQHHAVVYKSVSGVRSVAALFENEQLQRLDHITACPTQFQQYVAGTDHRIHVVGDELFACRIDSPATDYRYAAAAGARATLAATRLPDDVAARCLHLAKALGLLLAGIDLRVDDDGRWWCFEVNTSPGFVWFEAQTGQPIAAAVASLLAS